MIITHVIDYSFLRRTSEDEKNILEILPMNEFELLKPSLSVK